MWRLGRGHPHGPDRRCASKAALSRPQGVVPRFSKGRLIITGPRSAETASAGETHKPCQRRGRGAGYVPTVSRAACQAGLDKVPCWGDPAAPQWPALVTEDGRRHISSEGYPTKIGWCTVYTLIEFKFYPLSPAGAVMAGQAEHGPRWSAPSGSPCKKRIKRKVERVHALTDRARS
jgi:hypothetical protein